jgi:hypothetical protein
MKLTHLGQLTMLLKLIYREQGLKPPEQLMLMSQMMHLEQLMLMSEMMHLEQHMLLVRQVQQLHLMELRPQMLLKKQLSQKIQLSQKMQLSQAVQSLISL